MAIGGGSASIYWLKLIATVLDIPLLLPSGREFGAALGAARLGLLAATGSDLSDVLTAPDVSEAVTPVKDQSASIKDACQAFKSAYPGLRQIQ